MCYIIIAGVRPERLFKKLGTTVSRLNANHALHLLRSRDHKAQFVLNAISFPDCHKFAAPSPPKMVSDAGGTGRG